VTDDLATFLRARYAEARAAEMRKRTMVLDVYAAHDVVIRSDEPDFVFINDHPTPAAAYWESTTRPAPDAFVLADLDSKERILTEAFRHAATIDGEWGAATTPG
jgi:hypothetical protein